MITHAPGTMLTPHRGFLVLGYLHRMPRAPDPYIETPQDTLVLVVGEVDDHLLGLMDGKLLWYVTRENWRVVGAP